MQKSSNDGLVRPRHWKSGFSFTLIKMQKISSNEIRMPGSGHSGDSKNIKGIIFDIGGVIIHYPAEAYYKQLSNKFNIPLSTIAAATDPVRHELELGRINLHEMLRKVSASLNIKIVDSEFIKSFKDFARTDHEMVRLIKNLSGNYNVYLLTNISKAGFAMCDKELRQNGCRFDGKFASCYLHMRKPDPRIYHHVLRETGLKPQETIFIDDKKKNIEAASAIGMNGIVFSNMSQLIEDFKKLGITITADACNEKKKKKEK